MDPMDDLPAESRTEVVGGVSAALGIDSEQAERVVRASAAMWNVLDELGLTDSWGGGEYCGVFPEVCVFIMDRTNPG